MKNKSAAITLHNMSCCIIYVAGNDATYVLL